MKMPAHWREGDSIMCNYKQSRCDNCDHAVDAGSEAEIKRDIWQRIEAGGIVPSGECPECGALMYPLVEPSVIEVCVIGGVADVTTPTLPRGVVLVIRDYDVDGHDNDQVVTDAQGSKCVESWSGNPEDIMAVATTA